VCPRKFAEASALQQVYEHHGVLARPVVVRIEQGESHFLVESNGGLLRISHQESAANVGSNILDDHGQRKINQCFPDPASPESAIDSQSRQLYGILALGSERNSSRAVLQRHPP